ncbi:MAG: putative single-stranded DNA-binding protein [Prokaryotic dsDNA virus sp.]|nr:MAG: putative single-stranded DNA-binding protein [Prokaryotic dsDNA virus sp.]|tara:strand:+ start:4623 stop:5111 length:489 start_codon:yes stop_codon:yes gene_type:complete
MNTATFAGNVGQDPRINSVNTQNGPKSVLNFSLAVQKRTKDQQGNYETLWIDCALWGDRADKLSQYITKGTKLAVSGSVDVDSYEGNNGFVPKLTMMVNELTLQGGGQSQGQSNQAQGGYTQQQVPQQQYQQAPQQGYQQPQNEPQQQGAFNPNQDPNNPPF